MALTATLLTTGNSTGTVITTASIAPSANSLVVVFVASKKTGTAPNNPTVGWQSIDRPRQFSQVGSSDSEIKIHVFPFLAGATPGSGALTIDFLSQNQNDIMWDVVEIDGNTQDLPLQYAGNDSVATSTGIALALSAFGAIKNGVLAVVYDKAVKTITAKAGFTELSNHASLGSLETEFLAGNDTAPNWSWASGAEHVTALALEIKELTVSSPSASVSPSSSMSPSVSPSASVSPSMSASVSPSASQSPSASVSPSSSMSPSVSPSASFSPSASPSPSPSEQILSVDLFKLLFPADYTEKYTIKNSKYTRKYVPVTETNID